MRKFVLVLALAVSVLVPTGAHAAQTKFVGGPLTNLEPRGAVINAQLSEVPTRAGLYMQQCVESAAGVRPTLCNEAAQLWISTAQGASFAPTAAIQFKPVASFISGTTTVDCTVSKCGIFLRFDHTAGPNFSEDQFIPITFKSGATATVVLPADEITATINGVAVSTRAPITLGYRQIATVEAVSKVGAALTYASLSPNCGLSGKEITPLKGSGECAISVTSAATATSAGAAAILPSRLKLGVQTIPAIAAKKSVRLATVTNFGEKVSYQASGSCSVKKNLLTAKKGKCTVTASAAGQVGLFEALRQKVVLRIK